MSLYYAHTVSCLYSTQIYTAQENTLYLGTWQKALGIGSPPSFECDHNYPSLFFADRSYLGGSFVWTD